MISQLRVMPVNIEGSRGFPLLERLVEVHDPDVVITLQSQRADPWIREVFSIDYQVLLASARGFEARGIVGLVRRDVKVDGWEWHDMSERWIGPKQGLAKEPRKYPEYRLRKDDVPWNILGVHFPTFNNPVAQAESVNFVRDWLDANEGSVVGDFNLTAAQLQTRFVSTGAVLRSLGKVDHALIGHEDFERASKQRLSMPPSTHGWGMYDITRDVDDVIDPPDPPDPKDGPPMLPRTRRILRVIRKNPNWRNLNNKQQARVLARNGIRKVR